MTAMTLTCYVISGVLIHLLASFPLVLLPLVLILHCQCKDEKLPINGNNSVTSSSHGILYFLAFTIT